MTIETAVGSPLSQYAQELLQRLWTTKAVRFEASRRLAELDAASRLAISILSVYVIAVTTIGLLLGSKTAGAYAQIFAFVTIVAPVLILVLETHEGGKRYMVHSDRMHRCAQQIQVIHDRVERAIALGTVSPQLLDSVDSAYQAVLVEFAEHQDDLDYEVIRVSYPHRFPKLPPPTPVQRRRIRLARFANVWAMPILLILLPGILTMTAVYLLLGAK
jgi:SMODS and SLOG-associating 2TM effector domain family 5